MFMLVIGGAASGKSAFAESCSTGWGDRSLYVATMEPLCEEADARIERHRAQRAGAGFVTFECPRDLAHADVGAYPAALLDDIGNLVANELFAPSDPDTRAGGEDAVCERVFAGVERVRAACGRVVAVTCDVAADGIAYDDATDAWLRSLARINARLAATADCVVEVVCGIPLWIKGDEDIWKEDRS